MAIAVLTLSLGACETESSRSLELNTAFLSLKPTNEYSKSFANNQGDTVLVYLQTNQSSTENISSSGELGSFGAIERLSAETRSYQLSCDDPSFTLSYRFFIRENPFDDRTYSDYLSLEFSDSTGSLSDELSLYYQNDSIFILSNPFFYQDSLSLIANDFSDVLGPNISDPDEKRMFYYNTAKGLLGFTTREGVTFELID